MVSSPCAQTQALVFDGEQMLTDEEIEKWIRKKNKELDRQTDD